MNQNAETDQKSGDFPPLFCGIDLVEYALFRRYVEIGEDRFLERYYTPLERDYCKNSVSCLGARWAVKEAVSKALGTGFRVVRPIEIETRNSPMGKPLLQLYGNAARVSAELGIERWEISLSHEEANAIAIAVAFRQGYGTERLQMAVMDTIGTALQQKGEASGLLDATTKEFTKTFSDEG